jgi:hypothetical protein
MSIDTKRRSEKKKPGYVDVIDELDSSDMGSE